MKSSKCGLDSLGLLRFASERGQRLQPIALLFTPRAVRPRDGLCAPASVPRVQIRLPDLGLSEVVPKPTLPTVPSTLVQQTRYVPVLARQWVRWLEARLELPYLTLELESSNIVCFYVGESCIRAPKTRYLAIACSNISQCIPYTYCPAASVAAQVPGKNLRKTTTGP